MKDEEKKQETVTLQGEEVTRDKLQEVRSNLKSDKKIVEVGQDNYRILERMKG